MPAVAMPVVRGEREGASVRVHDIAYPCSFDDVADCSLEDLPVLPEGALRRCSKISDAIFGEIELAECDRGTFAVKRMKKQPVLDCTGGLESARNELHAARVLQSLDVPGMVEVLGCAQDSRDFYIAMEHCPHGELRQVLERLGPFEDEALCEIAHQVLVCLSVLHQAGVAHRDISLENVLVAADGTTRVCDFGQAILVHPAGEPGLEATVPTSPHGLPGTPLYRPPEVEESRQYSAKALDVFACGVLLFSLAAGSYPWETSASLSPDLFPPDERHEGRCWRIGEQLGRKANPAFVDLLEQMLSPCPKTRATAQEALAHPWLTGALSVFEFVSPSCDDDDEAECPRQETKSTAAPGSDAGESPRTADGSSAC